MPTFARSRRPWLAALVALSAVAAAAQPGDDPIPPFTASALLDASLLRGPHHSVAATVETPGFFHHFTIASDFGEMEANGLSQVPVRVDEVRALAELERVSKTGVFLKAAGGSVLRLGKSTVRVVTAPVDTAKGVGSGLKRLGVNLGRMTKRAVNDVGNETTSSAPKQNAGEGAANAVLGVSGAMRRWARKLGADPYTSNQTLFDALKEIGRIDAAGNIATSIVVPIPALVSTTATVGDLVWSKDPEELRKINEARLRDLGVPQADAQRFFLNRGYTLTMQTRLVAALDAVKPQGASAWLNTAAAADGERAALFYVESAEMLRKAHAAAPVTAVLEDVGTLVGRQGGVALVVLPLDYLASTEQTSQVTADIDDQARKVFGTTTVEVRLTGRASARLKADLAARGWTLKEGQ